MIFITRIVVKKYRHQLSSKKIISKENILNQNFSTKNICEKWLADITYIPGKWIDELGNTVLLSQMSVTYLNTCLNKLDFELDVNMELESLKKYMIENVTDDNKKEFIDYLNLLINKKRMEVEQELKNR